MMPTVETLAAFTAATVVMLVVPGPSVTYVVTRSIAQGRLAALYSVLGLETGALIHVGAATVGLAGLLSSAPVAYWALRYCGAAYLLFLGLRSLCRPPALDTSGAIGACSTAVRTFRLRLYIDGVLVDVLNPKTALFFVAFLPQFVDPGHGPVAVQVAFLGACFVVLAVICDGGYAVLATRLGRRFRGSERARARTAFVTGGIYIVLAGVTVLT